LVWGWRRSKIRIAGTLPVLCGKLRASGFGQQQRCSLAGDFAYSLARVAGCKLFRLRRHKSRDAGRLLLTTSLAFEYSIVSSRQSASETKYWMCNVLTVNTVI